MRNLLLFFFFTSLLFILSKCSTNIEEEYQIGDVKISSLPAQLIGQIAVEDSLLYLIKPFSSRQTIELWDINRSVKLDSGAMKGRGPKQVLRPPQLVGINYDNITLYDSKKLLVYNKSDLSYKKSLNPPGKDSEFLKIISIHENLYLGINLDESNPFVLFDSLGFTRKFGDYPVNNTQISNRYNVFQGSISYNSYNKYFLYAPVHIGYFAIYKIQGHSTDKLFEKAYFSYDYTLIQENNLIWNKNNKRGAIDGLVTKDYVVLLILENAKTGDMITGYENTPETILIFDLGGKLQRKIKLDKKVLRLANTGRDNVLYCIGYNPDFCLIKYEL